MKKRSAVLLAALAMTVFPVTMVSAAHADVCGNVGGPNVNVNGCLPPGTVGTGAAVVGSIAVADVVDEARQRAQGRPPCYTHAGVPYYTPGDMPCY